MAKSSLPVSRATDHNGNRRDLTQIPGNPAHDLHQAYADLMACDDPTALHEYAVDIVKSRLQQGGISEKNARMFFRTANSLKTNLARLQSYVTNFILKAAGLGVIGAY